MGLKEEVVEELVRNDTIHHHTTLQISLLRSELKIVHIHREETSRVSLLNDQERQLWNVLGSHATGSSIDTRDLLLQYLGA